MDLELEGRRMEPTPYIYGLSQEERKLQEHKRQLVELV
jgi:hypothetical protein